MNQLGLGITDFLIFFHMPFFVEMMMTEQIGVGICLVITLVVDIFERIRA